MGSGVRRTGRRELAAPSGPRRAVGETRRSAGARPRGRNRGSRAPKGKSTSILLIEDNRGDARLVQEMLAEQPSGRFAIVHATDLDKALERLEDQRFDAILLDLALPDARGLEGMVPLKRAAPDVPIVVLSGSGDEKTAIQAVQGGAQDYLVKGQTDTALLGRAIRYAIQRKRAEQQINYLAYHDGLTNLPNRRLLLDRLNLALMRARRNRQMLALLFLDLDHFKQINDTLGHAVGDELLVAVAERLKRCMRSSDTIARIGGDEFALVLPEVTRSEDINAFADKVQSVFRDPFRLAGREIVSSASMGISLFPGDAGNAEGLLKNADVAMYRAKDLGRAAYRFFAPAMNTRASERLVYANGLRHALEGDELVLHYQPVVDLKQQRIHGVEALLRWRHPKLGLVPPLKFLPLAEQAGLIGPIGEWVLRSACKQARAWRGSGLKSLRLAVNLSSQQLGLGGFPATVTRILKETGTDPGLLELELPESGLLHNPEGALQTLENLSTSGVRIAIDDFGTGYTSLTRLNGFPIDSLKIDRTYVRECVPGPPRTSVVTAIITMAHALKMEVTAEGVESAAQAAFLRANQCDRAQGVYFVRPLPAAAMNVLLRGGFQWPAA